MCNADTPTRNKTPLRRLGLARSIKRKGSDTVIQTTHTPKSVLITPDEWNTPLEDVSCSNDHKQRLMRSTSSIATSDSEDDGSIQIAAVNKRSTSKKTRLSLSQSWRNKIAIKQMNRRNLMDEVNKYSEHDTNEDQARNNIDTHSSLKKTTCLINADGSNMSTIKQRIQEVNESITVWRAGCVQALKDLQERRGSGNMESLLQMLQIPFALVHYDEENQEFLDPD